ncbi:hypothetical protein HG536_0A08560 [Torulaspora globosa]|uniref:Uncharacterized protein n=1 Tax=Torulaspora globosa TaxID=48254 RepID=A0A7G3ZC03_9SACH|nr:uncharacterized protein HG536_0A08560 [Torulaspora globosa]QLL31039.1 hypothetical protein HG536_0A08560 [Torulaspora globosa]
MSLLLEEEDLFPLSFAQHSLATPASPLHNDELDALINMPPPALSNSPNPGSEPDYDWHSYQDEIGLHVIAATTDDAIFTVDTEPLETPYRAELVVLPREHDRKLPDETADEFADAAQHNYRLWLASF